MANCIDMKENDVFICKTCGLKLQVIKSCSCIAGEEIVCSVPLQCCGIDMVKEE
jgi:hypothetical protein